MPEPRPTSPSQPPWRPSSPALDPAQFEDAICGDKVIIHFWAPWNPHDKQLDANLQQVQKKFPRLRFYSVNTDDTAFTPIVDAHHVAALPALVCFANGRSRGRFYGVETVEKLESFLQEMANTPQR